MNTVEHLTKALNNENIKRFKLEKQVQKLLSKLIELSLQDSEAFWSFAKIVRSFRHITSEDALIIFNEFEQSGIIVTRPQRGSTYYRFNTDSEARTSNLIFDKRFLELKAEHDEKIRKKIAKAKETLERYNAADALASAPKSAQQHAKEAFDLVGKEQLQEVVESLTALEKHQQQICDPLTCRFCLLKIGA